MAFIATFKPTVSVPLDERTSLLCYHGSPRRIRDIIAAETPDADLARMFEGTAADILAGGHVHAPLLRCLGTRTIINPGSAGLPGGGRKRGRPPWAEYAVLTWDKGSLEVSFRRSPVDIAAVRSAAREGGMPHPEMWTDQWAAA
jgi:predicted phosphodiesterase